MQKILRPVFSLSAIIPEWSHDLEFESPHSRNDYIWHSTSLDPWIPVAAVIGKVGCNKLRKLWFAIRPHTRLKLLEWLAAAINCSNSSSDVLNESL